LNNVTGPSGSGGNKLRTYRLFKTEYETELYCTLIMPPCHRTAFSKFRCAVALLRIETGRYEGLDVLENASSVTVLKTKAMSFLIALCMMTCDNHYLIKVKR
jgi:hypothetical protein